jgi:hypothetical protein
MQTKIPSKTQLWIGRAMSGLVVLFMLFDAIGKFIKLPEVVKATVNELGYAEHHLFVLGLLAIVATVLYAIPRTSVLGAILLTAYLGGAMASQLRVDHPLLSNTFFPLYLALLAWAGLLLREPFLSAFLFRKPVVEQQSSDVALSKAERQFKETMA